MNSVLPYSYSAQQAFLEQVNTSSSNTNTTAAVAEYNRQRNQMATVLDYLMTFVSDLSGIGMDRITLQSSTLAQLTRSTSALTRDATVRAVVTVKRVLTPP